MQQDPAMNIDFNWLGDNHWGVVTDRKIIQLPDVGTYNHTGLKYDRIKQLGAPSFYYQTN